MLCLIVLIGCFLFSGKIPVAGMDSAKWLMTSCFFVGKNHFEDKWKEVFSLLSSARAWYNISRSG